MMATIEQLGQALKNADAAGDVAAARALAGEIQRMRGVAPADAAPAQPQEPLSRMEKFGKGITDPISGGAQLLTNMLPKSVVNAGNAANNWLADKTGLVARLPEGGVDQQVREQEAAYEARRAAQGESGFDGYRMGGNILSPANLAMAARIPTAATAAGRIGLGALGGAAGGALAPVAEGDFADEKLKQIGTGAAVGGVLPVVTGGFKRLAKVLRAGLIDPFTEAGRQKIVGSALNRAASNPAEAAGNMSMSSGATPGFAPTAAQSANDAGIASLERGARAIDPAGFGDVDQTQKAALVNVLRSIAGTPESRTAAVQAREEAAKPLYGKAFESDRMRRSLVQESQRQQAPFSGVGGGAPTQDLATQGLRELANRPMFGEAINQARTLAANGGKRLDDPLQSLEGLHYIKLALDDMATPNAANPMGRNANAAVNDMRSLLSQELEKISPLYGNARQNFAENSIPINQQEIGQELLNRFTPPLSDGMSVPISTRASSLAQSLRDGDKLAQNVTGMKGARFDKIMSPEQKALLGGVVEDSQNKAFAESAGRGAGSDSIQKLSMTNLITQAGLPTWISALKPLHSVGGMARTVGDIIYSKNDETMRHLLADILKDPQRAAEAMRKANIPPSRYAEVLSQLNKMAPLPVASATVNDN